jgi:hypothetical protein
MRDKLNNNPVAQISVVAVLLVAAAFLVMSAMGGGEESGSTTTTTSAEVATPEGTASITATVTTPTEGIPVEAAPSSIASAPEVPAPPLPRPVAAALAANRTVVLVIVKEGGTDDALGFKTAASRLASIPRVSVFVVPVDRIARYAEITQAVEVERVPALVVVTPGDRDRGTPTASVSYGFQSAQSAEQAVIDARYRGRTLDYHP